jgi:CRP/FNR family transcriptional regulator, cyclic AMP receptor protein
MSAAVDVLRRLPLFDSLTPREIGLLQSHLRRLRLASGEILFEEGAAGRACYVVLSGAIGVYKQLNPDRRERLAVLGPGALVGHMALIDNKRRSASCEAGPQGCSLLELGRQEFDRLFAANSPFAFKILDRVSTDLSARLREATARLTEAAAAETDGARSEMARLAGEALNGYDNSKLDLDDVDLDAVTFEVPEQIRLQNTPTPYPKR